MILEEKKKRETGDPQDEFVDKIGTKSERRRKAQKQRKAGMWLRIGMFGLVGWSVAIPALLSLALGIWIDDTWTSRYSWTLMLLVLGIGLGCFNAWYWVRQEMGED